MASNTSLPWIEKYRPATIDDVSAQTEIVNVLKKTVETQNLPHLLFYGPPGTGKTSTILALAKDLFGPELYKSRVLELNASDERGIGIVREKIKNFAKTTVSHVPPSAAKYPCPPYKIIILDEADSMTTDAQAALRRTMEQYSKITRFCLICNYVSRIIEPLASRCAKFRFKPLPKSDIESQLMFICEKEGAIQSLIQVSEGDMRKAVMFIQSASKLCYSRPGEVGRQITQDLVREISGVVPASVIDKLVKCYDSKSVDAITFAVKQIIADGYSAGQILNQLYDALITSLNFTSLQKAKIAMLFSDTDEALTSGADEHLQILNAVVGVSEVVNVRAA
ncbi:P-loop containing nucleoside triphosphate hydrolase protein [Paraphysoderma sedebokerense]|nr:P-loop containing nucleoside triphosphate hydrolase protein [Paraphysoderma sedebokerense]